MFKKGFTVNVILLLIVAAQLGSGSTRMLLADSIGETAYISLPYRIEIPLFLCVILSPPAAVALMITRYGTWYNALSVNSRLICAAIIMLASSALWWLVLDWISRKRMRRRENVHQGK